MTSNLQDRSTSAAVTRADGRRQQTIFLACRICWGVVLTGLPPRVLRSIGFPPHGLSTMVLRALGLRHLIQAGAQVGGGSRTRRIGVALDFAHGTSMLLLGGVDARRRKVSFLDAAVATSLAVWGLALTIRFDAHGSD